MDVFYENKQGRIHFKGGGSAKNGFYIKEISGLGLPEKECNVAVYVNQAGQKVISERDIERMITLSIDVCSANQVQIEERRLFQVLHLPGVLTLMEGPMHRRIDCRCTGVEELQRKGRHIRSLILQFTCDYPYFTDGEVQEHVLFLRRDLISGNFVLPCVFTERVSRVSVVNHGTISVEPVIHIVSVGSENEEAALGDSSITVVNHTTGQQLTLQYRPEPGETVTVDIPARSIVSDKLGSIPEVLSSGSFLSAFYLTAGVNDVEVISHNAGEGLTLSLLYSSQYIEAVV
ncbi:MAG: hypothetical protein E7400_06710 [Ruminococcaceae bacterium]|nr:hypothetical protein [Oscillospiraceae bacterium]